MRKLFLLVVIATMAATGLFAQSKMSNRTKILVTTAKENSLANKPTSATIKNVNNIDYVALFIRFNDAIDRSVIEQYGGVVRAEYPATATVTANVPVTMVGALAADERVAYVEASQKMNLKMDNARASSHADHVMNGAAPLPHSFRGNGVIVGVVDQEIQVSHVNFWNEDRTRYRIKSFWNQNEEKGKGGFGFTYGKFFTDSASIIAEGYDVSTMSSGHATHVTGIAAGADHTMNYYGIAGEADIVITSTTGEDAALTDGVQYIFQYADSVDKPCVINISMGSELGPHDGTDLCSQILEGLVGPGKVIIGAAGNSGDAAMHLMKNFTSTDTIAKTLISLTYGSWFPYALMEAWGEEGKDFEMAVVAYSPSGDSVVYTTPFFRASIDTSYTVSAAKFGSTRENFSVEVATGISPLNNRPSISVQCDFNNVSSSYEVGVILRSDSGRVDIWTNDYYATFTNGGYGSRGWSAGDDDLSIGEGVAICKKVVAVGSYTNKDESYWSSATVGEISSFSSKGPTIDGRMKPEICAPGEGIYSSLPDKARSYDSEYTTIDSKKYYYGSMSGTSMACPYVTGVVATWLEADPTLDYDDLIDIFAHTSIQDKYTGYDLPDNTWGYGKINAYTGLIYILGLNEDVENVHQHQIVSLYPNPTYDLFTIGFATTDNVIVTVYDLSGRAVIAENVGNVSAGEERTFSLAEMPAGVYTVRISGEKQSNSYKLVKQ